MSTTDPDRPIFDPDWWRERIAHAHKCGRLWESVYQGVTQGEWDAIEANHRRLLKKRIRKYDSVLDVGCGYGRVLDLLSSEELKWCGSYTGVDLVPDFIELAKKRHNDPRARFFRMDLREPDARLVPPYGWGGRTHDYDWGVAFAVKNVVQGCGDDGPAVWARVETDLLRRCTRLLVVNYSPTDEGEVLPCD